MQASELEFTQIHHFTPDEFPTLRGTSILQFLEAAVIRGLDRFRDRLGASVVPSPLAGAWVREGGSKTSQHYIGPIQREEDGTLQSLRLGTAADFFPLCDIRHAFLTAVSMPEFGGIGVYLDTQRNGRPAPMMHLDLRVGTRQVWLRDAAGYLYPLRGDAELKRFFHKLAAW